MSWRGQDQRKFSLDKHLSIGDLIQICLIGFGGVWFIITMHMDITTLNNNVSQMSSDITDIKHSVESNVERLDKRIDDIVMEKKR